MKNEPGFMLIGTGFIMPRHVEAINAIGGKIKDVVNTAYGEYLFEDMIRHTSAENVVILAPNYFHRAMVRNALYRGKFVLCEKPLGISTKEVEDIIELEKKIRGKSVYCVATQTPSARKKAGTGNKSRRRSRDNNQYQRLSRSEILFGMEGR